MCQSPTPPSASLRPDRDRSAPVLHAVAPPDEVPPADGVPLASLRGLCADLGDDLGLAGVRVVVSGHRGHSLLLAWDAGGQRPDARRVTSMHLSLRRGRRVLGALRLLRDDRISWTTTELERARVAAEAVTQRLVLHGQGGERA